MTDRECAERDYFAEDFRAGMMTPEEALEYAETNSYEVDLKIEFPVISTQAWTDALVISHGPPTTVTWMWNV